MSKRLLIPLSKTNCKKKQNLLKIVKYSQIEIFLNYDCSSKKRTSSNLFSGVF